MFNSKIKILIPLSITAMMLCIACGGSAKEGEAPVMEGTIEVAEDLPDRDIVVPDYLKGEEEAAADEDETEKEDGGLEESKGEPAYHLSGEEQTEKARQVAAQIEDSINQVLADKEHYPNVTGISVNPECTEFNVTFSDRNLSLYENVLHMSLCIVGDRFQLYQGKQEEELMTVVNYVDGNSGEIFNTINSKEIE